MDLRALAGIESRPPLERSVISNNSRICLAVFISYIT